MRRVAVLGVALLMVSLVPAALAQDAPETAVIAKNLAENILGKGQVRSSRIVGDGRKLEMTWESSTFKPSNTAAHSRDLLRVEAEFASAAVFRVLGGVREMDFEIVLGKRSLCTGSAGRERPLRVTFARDLGN